MVFYIGLFSSPAVYLLFGFAYLIACSFGFFSKSIENPCADEFSNHQISVDADFLSEQNYIEESCCDFYSFNSQTSVDSRPHVASQLVFKKFNTTENHPPTNNEVPNAFHVWRKLANRPPPTFA